jgi:hypothetical protein
LRIIAASYAGAPWATPDIARRGGAIVATRAKARPGAGWGWMRFGAGRWFF